MRQDNAVHARCRLTQNARVNVAGVLTLPRFTNGEKIRMDVEGIRNEGWTIAFEILQTENYRNALVVIRPGLLENFQMRLNWSVHVVTVTPSNRDKLLTQIAHQLGARK